MLFENESATSFLTDFELDSEKVAWLMKARNLRDAYLAGGGNHQKRYVTPARVIVDRGLTLARATDRALVLSIVPIARDCRIRSRASHAACVRLNGWPIPQLPVQVA